MARMNGIEADLAALRHLFPSNNPLPRVTAAAPAGSAAQYSTPHPK